MQHVLIVEDGLEAATLQQLADGWVQKPFIKMEDLLSYSQQILPS